MPENISSAEWEVMRVIWTLGTASSRQIIDQLQAKMDWSPSTIKTLLRRLTAKAWLQTHKQGRSFLYEAKISEMAANEMSARDFFLKVCDSHKGQILTQLVAEAPLSQTDISALQEILNKKQKKAPLKVPCNCLPNQC